MSKNLHSNIDKSVSFYLKQTILSSFNFECVNSDIVEKNNSGAIIENQLWGRWTVDKFVEKNI